MSDEDDLHGLIDQIYAAAMDPDRYTEFVEFWNAKVQDYREVGGDLDSSVTQHLERATEFIQASDLQSKSSDRVLGFHQSSLAILVNKSGTIIEMTAAAEAAYGPLSSPTIKALPFTSASLELLADGIAKCVEDGEEHLLPLYRTQTEQGFLATLSFVFNGASGASNVLISTSEMAWHEDMSAILSGPLQLTESEISVLRMFFEGYGVSEIASLRNSSVHTIRTQMRSISTKTFTQTQGELVRLCAGLAAICREREGGAGHGRFEINGTYMTGPFPRPEHCKILPLPNGRLLDYSDFGPRDGMPVIMFHDDFFGDVWPAEMAERSMKEGLRIITLCRPGYGQTSAAPPAEKSYNVFKSDLMTLCHHLNLDEVYGLSRMTGMIYAIHSLMDLPVKVKGHMAVSPTLPYFDGVDLSKLPGHTRVLTRSVMQNKMALRFFTMTSRALDKRIGRTRRLSIGYTSQSDKTYVLNPDAEQVVLRGAALMDVGGALTWYHDLKDLGDDGGGQTRYSGIDFPFRVVVGEHDKTLRYERANAMKNAGIQLDVHQIDDAAELVFFTQSDAVLDQLLGMVASTT